jgi:glycosyltransferase involved in cell wall biosynthesis
MQDKVKWTWPNTSAYGDWVSVVVAISETVKESLVASGVDIDKIKVIDSGADVDSFVKASPDSSLKKSWGVDDDTPVICTAATLCENKGVDYIIQAAALLVQKDIKLHLVVAGDGPLRSELESLAESLQVPASFIGFQTDMPSVIASVDIFVMASMAEGLGIAVLEAMGSARPVIANAVGGLRESVVDGETGFLVPPQNPQAMSEAIEKLLINPDMAQHFGMAGRERVLTKYSIVKMAQRNEELYYELCGG